MKKTVLPLLLALALLFSLATTVFAADLVPQASCPAGFELHDFHAHDEAEHDGHHVGIAFDLNNDGLICVRHINSGLHVHLDNAVR